MARRLSNVIGLDDCPFDRKRDRYVKVVGAVFAGCRLDGVLSTRVLRDGSDATRKLCQMLLSSRAGPQLHAVLLQGIAFGGFNVVDIHGLSGRVGLPVLVVARRQPNLEKMRRALRHVAGARAKWRRIEQAGPMEPAHGVYIQRAGLSLIEAERLLELHTRHGHLPEPVRVAHLIAGGVTLGQSRGRA